MTTNCLICKTILILPTNKDSLLICERYAGQLSTWSKNIVFPFHYLEFLYVGEYCLNEDEPFLNSFCSWACLMQYEGSMKDHIMSQNKRRKTN